MKDGWEGNQRCGYRGNYCNMDDANGSGLNKGDKPARMHLTGAGQRKGIWSCSADHQPSDTIRGSWETSPRKIPEYRYNIGEIDVKLMYIS